MGISYSVEADPETTAKAMLRDRNISLKHSKAVAREIKGETVEDAESYLEAVIEEDRSVPMRQHNSGVGHRSDIDGWDAGRYPEQAAEDFLKLLGNIANNAERQGFDPETMVIKHTAAHKVGEQTSQQPRAMGRASPHNTPEVDVEMIVEEVEN